MKKIFTTIAAALLLTSAANAAITVKVADKDIENGSTLYVGADGFKLDHGVWESATNFKVNVDANARIDCTSTSGDITICDEVGQCHVFHGEGTDLKFDEDFPMGTRGYDLHAMLDPVDGEKLPDFKATFTATITSGSDQFKFTIEYDTNGAALDEINVDNSAEAVYYNLQGVRVANPEAGNLYIRVAGKKAAKVIF